MSLGLCKNCTKIGVLELFTARFHSTVEREAQSGDVTYTDTYERDENDVDPHQLSFLIAKNVASLELSAQQGCMSCKFTWQAIATAGKLPDEGKEIVGEIRLAAYSTDTRIVRKYSPDSVYNDRWADWPTLTLLPWKILLQAIEAHSLRREMSGFSTASPVVDCRSESIYRQARKWIAQCLYSHGKCSTSRPQVLPIRVIDVGNDIQNDTIHLVPGEYLYNTDESKLEYLALSYKWGAPADYFVNENTAQKHCTTPLNIESRYRPFEISELPRTIRDSINVTRRLGYRYLWIDSICITQTPKDEPNDDRDMNIAMMEEIYANATCVLAASDSDDSDQGLLRDRHWAKYNATSFEMPIISPDTNNANTWTRSLEKLTGRQSPLSKLSPDCRNLKCRYFSCDQSSWSRVGGNTNLLERRAWCLQERVLAIRRICFSDWGLYWECCTMIASEAQPDGGAHPKTSWMHDLRYAQPNDNSSNWGPLPGSMWRKLCREYTSRQVSDPNDRLPAIAGVARTWKSYKGPEDDYLAGLWRSTIIYDLCWTGRAHLKLDRPSWSWAAQTMDDVLWDSWNQTDREGEEVFAESTYVSHDIQPEGDDPFSRVKSGRLTLRGPFVQLSPEFYFKVQTSKSGNYPEEWSAQKIHRRMYTNSVGSTVPPVHALVLARFERDEGKWSWTMCRYAALLLSSYKGRWRRIGLFETSEEDDFRGSRESEVDIY